MTQNDGIHGKAKAKNWAIHTSKLERSKIDLKVNAWMRTEIDLNESEIDLNESEIDLPAQVRKCDLKRSECERSNVNCVRSIQDRSKPHTPIAKSLVIESRYAFKHFQILSVIQ